MNIFKNRKYINIFIIAINVLFVGAIAFGEYQYIHSSRSNTIKNNKVNFISTNTSLSSMTSNYLVGESHLCRSWANYLNSEPLTMESAIEFVSASITDEDIMGHIVDATTLKGLSTKGHRSDVTDKSVDYSKYFLSSVTYQENTGVKASPQYSNPVDPSKKAIAFYTEIKLQNTSNPSETDNAFLLRVVPITNLESKWTFPSSFERMDVAIIDNSNEDNIGAYIFNHSAFKGSTFFEYYNSYNSTTESALKALQLEMASNEGSLTMKDPFGKELYVAYSQIPDPGKNTKWTIITAIPMEDLTNVSVEWSTISIIGIGLGTLFIIDLIILLLLNKSIQDTAKIAESANKAKTDFLSTMSHDIRTPMNAIVGLTHIASYEEGNPENTKEALKKIASASNHLLTLINDILDISKVESGKLTINPISFSIKETFENLININQPLAVAKNIDFTLNEENIVHEWLYADKLRLSQIFTNLLSNALKYTGANGKVTVTVKELDSDKEGYIKLVYIVSDTGIGMSPEYIERMYEPFTRATDSRINSIQGTGLGLAITKQMVDLMSGSIECESTLGEGTTFTVTIDLAIAKEEKQVDEIVNMTFPGTRILVVEDNEINWEIISTILARHEIVCERAVNGKEALDIIKEERYENPYDLIFMDIQMPVMNGLDATRAIRELDSEYAKIVPIIAMTADAFSENVAECLAAGMNGHIAKPIDLKLVLNEIKKVKE